MKHLTKIRHVTVSGHDAVPERTASLFNFPSAGKLQAQRLSPFEWQMKTACDHFLIITTAEILRAANYQSDLMAVRHQRMRHTKRRCCKGGGNITWGDVAETNKKVREGEISGSVPKLWHQMNMKERQNQKSQMIKSPMQLLHIDVMAHFQTSHRSSAVHPRAPVACL